MNFYRFAAIIVTGMLAFSNATSGQQYRTGNPDANPNGALAGQWTEQIVYETARPQ